jgi:hypothetical protein
MKSNETGKSSFCVTYLACVVVNLSKRGPGKSNILLNAAFFFYSTGNFIMFIVSYDDIPSMEFIRNLRMAFLSNCRRFIVGANFLSSYDNDS